MKRGALVLTLSFPLAILPFIASAAEVVPYTPHAFAAAQKAGDPILVEITASWCPTCKAQKPILSKFESDPKFKDLKVFDVDFDSQKDVVRTTDSDYVGPIYPDLAKALARTSSGSPTSPTSL